MMKCKIYTLILLLLFICVQKNIKNKIKLGHKEDVFFLLYAPLIIPHTREYFTFEYLYIMLHSV